MGRYISFRAEYSDVQAFPALLHEMVGRSVFRPHAIAAINYREPANRVFLARVWFGGICRNGGAR